MESVTVKFLLASILIANVMHSLPTNTDVSGGPFGIEPSIRAAGNFYSILGTYTTL